MSKRCPYLGLKESRDEAALTAHPQHRCYYTHEPQRIGSRFQASTCLGADYLRCPRLATRLPLARKVSRPCPPAAPRAAPPPPVRYTELRPIPRHRAKAFEFLIVGLVVSLIAGTLSLGVAVTSRLRLHEEVPGAVAMTTDTYVALIPTVPAIATATTTATATATATVTATPPATRAPTLSPATRASPSATPTVTASPAIPTPVPRPPAVSPPTRLVIAKIGLDIPVKPVGAKEIREGGGTRIVWDDVPNAGAFHNTSAYPGNWGNTVINGHRDIQGSVFAHLDRLGVGDEIMVYVGEVVYRYQVSEVLVVPETYASSAQRAENQRLLGDAPEERLTLVTCTPVGLATHRLVVIAVPPDLAAPQVPAPASDS